MDNKTIEIVKEWFNKTENWQKDAFVNLWKSKDVEEVKKRALKLVLKECGYAECTYVCDIKFPEDLEDESDDKSQTVLKSISDIQGVAALTPTRSLEFTNGLNVVFGANGCGKSSYVKVLKKAENPKDDTKIHSNIFIKNPPSPKATIKFSEDGNEIVVNWDITNKKSLPIRIYDSKVAQRFVEKSNETIYEPKLLHTFTLLAEVLDYVNSEVTNEYRNNESRIERFPNDILDSSIYREFNSLDSKDSIDEFEKRIVFSDEDEKELNLLIKNSSDSDPVATNKKLSAQISILENLQKQLEKLYVELDESRVAVFLESRTAQINTRRLFEDFLVSSKKYSSIEEFGSQAWKDMWKAAKTFSESITNKDDDMCVLCQQKLSDDARKRMEKFTEIYASELEKKQSKAQKVFSQKVEDLGKLIHDDLNIINTKQTLITNAFDDEIVSYIENVMEQLLKRANWLYNYDDSSPECPTIENYDFVNKRLIELISIKNDEQASLREFIDNYDKQLVKKITLRGKKWLSENKDNISLKRNCIILGSVQPKLKTTNITRTKNKLSEKMITEVYINRFNSELSALNPSHSIKVELVADGKKAITSHKVSIKGAVEKKKTEEILSEGEYRVVSIAAFLADLNSLNKTQAFVFDDPITSLDHNYEDNVAKQLVKLSCERQVIVFTHRIAFAETLKYWMDEILEKHPELAPSVKYNYIELKDDPLGEPVPMGSYNRLDFISVLNTIKNHDIPNVDKLRDSGDYDLAEAKLKSICSDMRKNVERGIEKVLLNGLITRYTRNISTLKIDCLNRIKPEDVSLINTMMTKYSFYEHSQPSEKPINLPTNDELLSDIETLLTWGNECKKRMNKK